MNVDPLSLGNDLSEWDAMMRRARRGDQVAPEDVVQPPPIRLGVILRSATRRYADSKIGTTIGGMFWAAGPVSDDDEPSYRVVEVKANAGGGTRVEWHTITGDDLLMEEFTGAVRADVLRALRRRLLVHFPDHEDDDRYLTALRVIAMALS